MKYSIAEIKKTNLDDTFFGKYFFRTSATFFTYFLARTPLTPNQISFLSLACSVIGAILISFGIYKYAVIGVVLAEIGMILDYSDGQIARLKKQGTKRGAWLDVLLGMIQNNILILGIILGMLNIYENDFQVWFLGFTVLFAWNMTCFVHLNAMIFFPNLELKKTQTAGIFQKLGINPQYLSLGSDIYFVVIGLSILLSKTWEGLLILAILGSLYWISVFFFIFYTKKNGN